MCNGWTSNNMHHIVNFMVYCVTREIFLKFVNTSNHRKDACYLHGLIKEMINKVGAQHIVQLVTDETSFKAIERMTHKEFPTIVWTPCAAHCMNIMFKDISKMQDLNDTMKEVRTLTSFI